MAGGLIRVRIDDKKLDRAITGIMRLGTIVGPDAYRSIGVALVETTQRRFESATGPWGSPWKALNPAYAMIKRGPGILRASGMLQRFITSTTSGNRVTVGSNRKYAAVHQFGAFIVPKRAKALAFRLGGGKRGRRLVFAKRVRIPARPYLGFGPKDQEKALEVVQGRAKRALGG